MAELLSQQTRALKTQLEKYRGLLAQPLPDPAMIHVGDGYFVSMPVAEAQEFLRRKITDIEGELGALNQLNGVNEEGLPVFDIVEELDEDGEIISSKVNKTGLASQLASANITEGGRKELTTSREHDSAQSQEIPGGVTKNLETNTDAKDLPAGEANRIIESTQKDSANGGNPDGSIGDVSAVSQLDGASLSPSDDDVQYIEDVSELPDPARIDEDRSSGEFPDINPADVLELELMQGEDDDNVTDFNFDDVEEDSDNGSDNDVAGHFDSDDDEDEDEDEDEWSGASLFPQDEATMKLIEAHLAMQNKPLDTPEKKGDTKKNSKNAHVHFAESVDVREFETSSQERKYEAPTQKLSRFRMARQIPKPVTPLGRPNNGLARSAKTTKPTSAAAAAAAAVVKTPHASPPSSAINKTVVERNQLNHPATPSPSRETPAKRSGPTPLRKASIPHTELQARQQSKASQNPITHMPIDGITPPAVNSSSKSSEEQKRPPSIATPAASLTEKELKIKIRADAESLFNNSFVPDDEFLKLHDAGEDEPGGPGSHVKSGDGAKPEPTPSVTHIEHGDSALPETAAKPVGDKPLLSSVLERSSIAKHDNEDYADIGNDVNMTEIKQEYQRLRQKLIYESGGFKKTDSEKAVEPIAADGEPKKVSRFKAARII